MKQPLRRTFRKLLKNRLFTLRRRHWCPIDRLFW
jgi:hypothetical protein